ncbi:MAG: phosphoribose diphosphate--decaprenyl-phosphate phosphoribosyltransferase [Cytophagaceae bacterium]|nr:phosphoribose diphosphate--decaprenyl-phosphate phosphoribosyltransferase [Cytophagaceae bacterium]
MLAITNCADAMMWSGAYLLLNILYTFVLKKYSIIDAVAIACGFVIRIYMGASVGELTTSGWIVVLVFIMALLLAFGKRRDDLNNFEKTTAVSRTNVFAYSVEFLNVILSVLSAVIAVTYIQYTLSPEVIERVGKNLFVTVPLVVMGLLRYLQIVLVEKKEFNPTDILWKDAFLQLTIAAWILMFLFFIYF